MRKYDSKEFMDINGKGTAFASDVKKVKIENLPVGNPVLPDDAGTMKMKDKEIRSSLKVIRK